MDHADYTTAAMLKADKTVKDMVVGLTHRQANTMLSSLLIYTVQAMMNERGRQNTITTLIDAAVMVRDHAQTRTEEPDAKD